MPGFSVSVVFPVYNEKAALEHGLTELVRFLERSTLDAFEVVVIESGSTDRTGEIADRLAAALPCVRVIHEGRRNGFGAAVRLGYQSARLEWIWLVTPDLPFPLESLHQAAPLLDRCDAILSYRKNVLASPFRRLQSLAFNALIKAALGLRVRCVNSAFKLVKRRLIEDVTFHSRGWTLDAELIWVLQNRGARFVEIPVELLERVQGSSKISLATPLAVLMDIVKLRLGPCRRWREPAARA